MSLAPAPVDPYDDVRVLVDGDLCDARGCEPVPAVAYVRVYIYAPGTTDLLGAPLHFCGHHWENVADKMVQLALDGGCSIRDERQWLTRYTR